MIRGLRETIAFAAVALITVGVGIGLSAAGAGQAAGAPAAKPAAKPAGASSKAAMVARGKYIVSTAACHDCHTPAKMGDNGPEPDMARMLSGHPPDMTLPPPPQPVGPWIVSGSASFTAWSGPWGISYTANLTPDKDTGPRHVDSAAVHRHDSQRPRAGSRAPAPAADAVAGVSQPDRQRPARGLRVPPDDPGNQEQGAGSGARAAAAGEVITTRGRRCTSALEQ